VGRPARLVLQRCHQSESVATTASVISMHSVNFPACLTGASTDRSTVRDLAVRGFQTLVDAALQSGGPGCDPKWNSTVDARQLAQRLGDFWHRLRIPLRGVTGDPADYVEALERKIEATLDPQMHDPALLRGAPVARLHVLGLATLHMSDDSLLARRCDGEGLLELVARVEVIGASYWRSRLLEQDICLRYAERPSWDAGTLALACLCVLQDQLPEARITTLDVAALALIGALRRQVAKTYRCRACFRWSEPGTDTCGEHRPIDPRDVRSGSDRALRIERARELACEMYGEPSARSEPSYERCVGSLNWLSGTLWPTEDEHESDLLDILMPMVASLPNLLEAMHTTAHRLRRDWMVIRLRRHIDPLEVRTAAWPYLALLANAWHHAEVRGYTPVLRGPTIQTMEKARAAMEVAARTGKGRNAVAKEVGVHPTLISHWRHRIQRTESVLPPQAPGKRPQGIDGEVPEEDS
jgi:hypothetical protein